MLSVACVVVGDTGVGKTSLLIEYTTNAIPWEYIPTVFDPYSAHLMMHGRPMELSLFDVYADDDVAKDRAELYSKADVVMILFDVMDRDTFKSVKSKWKNEIDLYCPDTPYVLVGNKHWVRRDYYDEHGQLIHNHHFIDSNTSRKLISGYAHKYSKRIKLVIPDEIIAICHQYYFISVPVTKWEGMDMAKEIGAKQYLEHTLMAQDCLHVFDQAIREAMKVKKAPARNKKSCHIL